MATIYEIENHMFNDPALDNMKDFNHSLRGLLIDGKIDKQQYIYAELALSNYYNSILDFPLILQTELSSIIGGSI